MRPNLSLSLFAVSIAGIAVCTLSFATPENKEERLPAPAPAQPIQFSHKQHAELGMECGDCHGNADRNDQAGMPDVPFCMGCHETVKTDSPEVKKLAELYRRGERLRWVRVYKVPAYVFFSHATHVRAGQKCAACHGPVQTREVLAQEVSTRMAACLQCHRARKASTSCSLCHQLGQ